MRQALLLLAATALGACAFNPKTMAQPTFDSHEFVFAEHELPEEPASQPVAVEAPTPEATPAGEPKDPPFEDEDEDEDEAVTHAATAPVTTYGLCEPIDTRRPWPTKAEQKETRALIRSTCRAMGVDRNSCKYFILVSSRESSYRFWVRHKKAGDTAAAVRGWVHAAWIYGWEVRWPHQAQKREDVEAIVMVPRRADSNPYYADVERWLTGGLGLGGLNVGYHLAKFDPMAPPEILCDPVINVIVQIELARSAVDRYGAKNFYEVQAVYAGRTYTDSSGRARALSCAGGCPSRIRGDEPKNVERRALARKKDKSMRRRCESYGMDCMAVPKLGNVLRHNATPAERYALAEKVRGAPLPPFDPPPNPSEVPPQVVDSFDAKPQS